MQGMRSRRSRMSRRGRMSMRRMKLSTMLRRRRIRKRYTLKEKGEANI